MPREVHAGPAAEVAASKLDELIEEAIVDCYGESEEIGGFYSMLEDNLDVCLSYQTLASNMAALLFSLS